MRAFSTDAREAFTATPAFGPDGALWVARGTADRVVVAKSTDLGKTFSEPVSVPPMRSTWTGALIRGHSSPSRRAVQSSSPTRSSRTSASTGASTATRSTDGGTTFAPRSRSPPNSTSQRFQTVGDRSRRPGLRSLARQAQRRRGDRRGQALSRCGTRLCLGGWRAACASPTPSSRSTNLRMLPPRPRLRRPRPARAAVPQCLRGLGARPCASSPSRTRRRPGPLRRVSVDNWKIEACPHQGPSLAIAPDGSYHAAWFTGGSARQGLFYARADNADAPFSAPRALSSPDRQPARPYLLPTANAIHLVWKEFDGEQGTGPLAGRRTTAAGAGARRAPSPKPPMPRIIPCSSPAATTSICPG